MRMVPSTFYPKNIMAQITQVLPAHHKHCDELFSLAEEAAQNGDWPACEEANGRFARELRGHLEAEETLLFPAFEDATGMRHGPTQMMRLEHEQMRDLVGQLETAAAARDADTFSGVAETLLILMQQHNMKEENILYPMCDQALGAQVDELSARVSQHLEGKQCRNSR